MPFSFSLTSNATSDASSRTPHGSFPFLTATDAQIISQIVNRTPRNTPTFNAILNSYNAVLDQNQLDHQSREKYYSLLLKLSLVTGQDWHERWSRVCASQGLGTHEENNSTQHLLRLSPPSNSQDSLESSVEDASRTIRANPLHTHPDSPPLQSPVSTRLTIPRAPYRQIQSTPNKLTRFTPSRTTASSTVLTESSQDGDGLDLGSRFVDPLDALADRFRRETLLRLGFHTWKHLSNYWGMANNEAHLGRGKLIVGYAWRKFRSRFGKRQREIKMVDGVAKTRSKSAILIQWRVATAEKQRIRRKNYESQATTQIQTLMNRNILSETFTKWAMGSKLLIIQRLRDNNLKSIIVNRWFNQFSAICRLSNLADNFRREVNASSLLRSTMAHWKWKTDLKVKEFHIIQISAQRMLIEVMDRWCQLATSSRLAYDFWVRNTQKTCLRAWAHRRYRLKKMQRKANRVIAVRNHNLAGKMMNLWMIQERGRLLGRILLTRLIKNTFASWMTRFNRIRHYLDAKRQVFQKKVVKRQTAATLKEWRDVYQHKSIQLNKHAVDRYRISLVARHLNRWMIVFSKIQDYDRRTRSEWRMRRLKQVWSVWSARLRRARGQRLVRRRKRRLLRQKFNDWATLARQKKEDHKLCIIFENRVNPNRKRWALRIWVKRVVDFKECVISVERNYSNHLLSSCFDVWIDRICDIRHYDELANGFAEIQKIELRSRLLDFWRTQASDSRRRSGMLAVWFESRDRIKVRSAWTHWSDKTIEQSLKVHENETREMVDDRLREQSLQMWLTKSKGLPALRFNRKRLKTSSLRHWSKLTEVRQLRQLAVSRDRKSVLGEAFKVWWGKCAAIKASRIVSRFSRPSAFSGGNRQRTRSSHQLPEVSRRNLIDLTSNPSSVPISLPGRRVIDLPVPPPRRNRDASQHMYDSTTSGDESSVPMSHNSQTNQPEESLEEEEEYEEDQTILGDASEMMVTEEISTTETEALTEVEIERVMRRRITTRRFAPVATYTPTMTQQEESDATTDPTDYQSPILSSRSRLNNPLSSAPPRSRNNHILIGLRNLDPRRAQRH